jgi:hypothetical protein
MSVINIYITILCTHRLCGVAIATAEWRLKMDAIKIKVIFHFFPTYIDVHKGTIMELCTEACKYS